MSSGSKVDSCERSAVTMTHNVVHGALRSQKLIRDVGKEGSGWGWGRGVRGVREWDSWSTSPFSPLDLSS